ncbi:hypothetical protein [Caulobacter sp.]|uniref:hypothetical protein n=1 Tax=Caulobacter sp. TaxID=78 RepID=UPI0031DFC569
MVNLAQTASRQTDQTRVTNNRDVVLPRARQTNTPEVRVRADMRNASRGNAVDEVRQALGLVDKVVDDYAEMSLQQHFEAEKTQALQAQADYATGTVDPEAVKRSAAYAEVLAVGRARTTAADLEARAKTEVETLLAGGEADLDDVNAKLDELFKPSLFNEDGSKRDYGSPQANAALYRELLDVRTKTHAQAQEVIAGQVRQKGLTATIDTFTLDARKGNVDVEGAIQTAGRLGITPQAAKLELRGALVNLAMATDNPELLETAANSRKADGSRTWNAGEENGLLDAARTLRAQVEAKTAKAAQDASNATLGAMAIKVRQGHRLTTGEVQAYVDSGQLRPQDVDNLFAVQEHWDDEQRQKLERGRSDIRWAQSQQEHRMALADRAQARADRAAGRAADEFMLQAYSVGANPQSALATATRLYANRKIDGDTFRVLQSEIGKLPADSDVVKQAGAEDFKYVFDDNWSTFASRAGRPGYMPRETFEQRKQAAYLSFYRSLRKGAKPEEAMRAGFAAANIPEDRIDPAIREASARATTPTRTEVKKK